MVTETFSNIDTVAERNLLPSPAHDISDTTVNVSAETAWELRYPATIDPELPPIVDVPEIGAVAIRSVEDGLTAHLARGSGYGIDAKSGDLMLHKFWVRERSTWHKVLDKMHGRITYPLAIESIHVNNSMDNDPTLKNH